jgi:hypothetical protein
MQLSIRASPIIHRDTNESKITVLILIFCVSFLSILCSVLHSIVSHFALFLLAIALFVILRIADSDYSYGILKLFAVKSIHYTHMYI